jgi:hypothetical protein
VETWPVQFVPVFKPLEIEALAQAARHPLEGTIQPFVLSPEFLIALAPFAGLPIPFRKS